GSNAGTKDPESKQRNRRQQQTHGRRDIDRSGQRRREFAEDRRSDTNDDRQHHDLDARGDNVAERLFGQERGFAPQRKRHQDETRQRSQLELNQGDKELHRQHEEGENDQDPAQQKDQNGRQVGQDIEAGELTGLLQQRVSRGE